MNIYLEPNNQILSRIILDIDLVKDLCEKYNMIFISASEHMTLQYGVPQAEYYYYEFDKIEEGFFNELNEKINKKYETN